MTLLDTPSDEVRIDGRRRRSEQTRLAIILAFLDLLRRNGTMPTARRIARAAGCSPRSIFERFTDLDALAVAAAGHAIAQAQAEAVTGQVQGDRPTRIRCHVETRAAACERWLPLWRVLTGLDRIAELRRRVAEIRLANIERLQLMYAPELFSLGAQQRTGLLIALAALTSFESWDQMRHCHDLSLEDAQAVWQSALDRMLPPAG